MKTSFTKLFTLIAVVVALAGGVFSSPARAQGLIGRLIHGVLDEIEYHQEHDHGHGHSFNGGHNGHSFHNGGHSGHSNGGHQWNRPPVQQGLPTWLVGTWTVNDGRMGGKTELVMSGNSLTTVGYSFSQFGYRETSRSVQSASYTQNGLLVGNNLYRVTSTTPGTLTLTGNGTTVQLVRAGQPINNNGNNGQININNGNNNQGQIIQISNRNRLPVTMQGTWYEVSLNSRGEQILNRYDLGADGSYEMFQYAISAQGDVDLSSPAARLSQIATIAQRSVKFENGLLSLGAGQRFAEGPYTATATGSTLILVDSTETRTWTRQP